MLPSGSDGEAAACDGEAAVGVGCEAIRAPELCACTDGEGAAWLPARGISREEMNARRASTIKVTAIQVPGLIRRCGAGASWYDGAGGW